MQIRYKAEYLLS